MDVKKFVDGIAEKELKNLIADVTMNRYELSGGWTDIEEPDPVNIAKSALIALRRQSVQKQIEQNQRLLKEASLKGEDTLPFIQQHQEFLRMMKDLETQVSN